MTGKITGFMMLKNRVYCWWKEGVKDNEEVIILTIKETSKTSQEEQQAVIDAICNIGFEFKSIWAKNIRFEKSVIIKEKDYYKRLGKIKFIVKDTYKEICETLKKL